jgi:hypothetical protein
LKGIPPKIVQHKIELDTIVPHAHQTRYKLNFNYVAIVKQDINKLLVVGFIKPVEETIWLSIIMVVSKTNGKLCIYVDLKKFKMTINKDTRCLLPMRLLTQLLDMKFIPL